ncbi:galactokinase [Treponema sp.]
MKDIGAIHREEYETDADRSEPVIIAEAPGRLHLLGEHGEAGNALHLSAAIDRSVRLAVSLRKDSSLRFFAADLGERKRTTLINLKYKREDRWANFIKLAVHGFAERGYPVKGFNFTIIGEVPQQVGLASSSAIEVATAIALRKIYAPEMSEHDLVELLETATIGFLGRSDSSIDHLIALTAIADRFMVIDERTMSVKSVELPFKGYRLLLTDSRVPRLGVEGELKQRRSDIRKSLELLTRKKPGASFRDFDPDDLVEAMGSLPEQIRRRCMHVVQEAKRVVDAEEILKKGDLAAFAKIVYHSHESLRDLYEVSCPEIDWLVKRSQEIEGVLCSRMTGQGFGGCTYSLVAEESVTEYQRRLEDYERIFGFRPLIYDVKGAGPARLI